MVLTSNPILDEKNPRVLETEATEINNKPLVSDEPINVPNSKKAATEKSSSITKLAGDISQSESKLDAVSEVSQEKPNIQSVVRRQPPLILIRQTKDQYIVRNNRQPIILIPFQFPRS